MDVGQRGGGDVGHLQLQARLPRARVERDPGQAGTVGIAGTGRLGRPGERGAMGERGPAASTVTTSVVTTTAAVVAAPVVAGRSGRSVGDGPVVVGGAFIIGPVRTCRHRERGGDDGDQGQDDHGAATVGRDTHGFLLAGSYDIRRFDRKGLSASQARLQSLADPDVSCAGTGRRKPSADVGTPHRSSKM